MLRPTAGLEGGEDMRQLSIVMTTIAVLCGPAWAGEWLGPDILNADFTNWSISGTSSIYQSQVAGGNLRMGLLPKPYWVINQTLDHTMTGSRSVSVTPGKRYRYDITGREQRSVVTGSVNVDWWGEISGGPSTARYSSTSYQTASVTYVPGGGSMTVRAGARITASPVAELYHDYAEYDSATLRQVVYDPQLDIAETSLRVNSDAPGGSTASIALGLNSLSFADDPDAWSMDWGDGHVDSNPTLNAPAAHSYAIPSGNTATWTAIFQGSNGAGGDSDTAMIEVLRQPDIALVVNGLSVVDGGTVAVDIIHNPILDLSLLDSLGYIEATGFSIPGRLSQVGSGLTLSTNMFDQSDIGQVFPLTAMISNTGAGSNADQITVNLFIVPEPVTLSLFAFGGFVLLRRGAAARTRLTRCSKRLFDAGSEKGTSPILFGTRLAGVGSRARSRQGGQDRATIYLREADSWCIFVVDGTEAKKGDPGEGPPGLQVLPEAVAPVGPAARAPARA